MPFQTLQQTPSSLVLRSEGGLLRLQFREAGLLRVTRTPYEHFSDRPSRMIVPATAQPVPAWQLVEHVDSLEVTTDRLRLWIERAGGALRWEELAGGSLLGAPACDLKPIELPGRAGCSARQFLQFSPGEALYGLGQHEEGILNYRGHQQYLYQHNLKVALPVLVSSRGYALLFDTCALSTFHDDVYGAYFWTEAADELDYYFLLGPELDDLVAGLRRLTGSLPMLPRWSYGYIQSKERYKSQAELVEIVAEYRRRGIPLDGVVLDWLSWPGNLWGQKTLDPERFPEPAGMMAELHRQHARLMVSVWPKMSNDGPDQLEMRAAGFLLEDGQTYDAFNPAARALYWRQARTGLFEHGIDAWWCDSTEPFDVDWNAGPVKPEPEQRLAGNTAYFKQQLGLAEINAYSLLHSQGIYEGQRTATSEKRVLNLTRSAYPGQQRYATVTWSGDTPARWEVLRKQIPDGLNFTVTGNPRWTLDVGAFFVKKDSTRWFWNGDFPQGCADPGYRELFVRWFQYGAFLPMFRAHGTDTPREVWRFGEPGEPAYDALVKFIHLRYRLLPYIYSLSAWEVQRDYTMLRSLAFDFRADPLALNVADQFMLGPALLVCPVVEPMDYGPDGQIIEDHPHTRAVYLPAGSSWYDFWTGKRYSGGQRLQAPAPLGILPLYVRAGSILPLGPLVQHSGEQPGGPLEVRIYPGADAAFDLYEDEGDSYRCEQGEQAWTPLRWDERTRTLQAGPRAGSYRGMPARRQLHPLLVAPGSGVGVEPAASLDFDGAALRFAL